MSTSAASQAAALIRTLDPRERLALMIDAADELKMSRLSGGRVRVMLYVDTETAAAATRKPSIHRAAAVIDDLDPDRKPRRQRKATPAATPRPR